MSVVAPGAGLGLAALAGGGSASAAVAAVAAVEVAASRVGAGGVAAGGIAAGGVAAGGVAAGGVAAGGVRAPDTVVIRAAAPVAVFREMAVAGLRQLGVLVAVIERQVEGMAATTLKPGALQPGALELGVLERGTLEPAALGHLARAVGDAAYQVSTGFAAMTAAEAPEMLMTARSALVGPAAGEPAKAGSAKEGSAKEGSAKEMAMTAEAPRPGAIAAAATAKTAAVIAGAGMVGTPGTPGETIGDVGAAKGEAATGALLQDRAHGAGRSPAHPASGRVGDPGGPREADAGGGTEALVRWRGAARQVVQQASDALATMGERLQSLPAHSEPDGALAPAGPDLIWAAMQVAGAQRQVSASLRSLEMERAGGPGHRRWGGLSGAGRRGGRWWAEPGSHGATMGATTGAVAVLGVVLLVGAVWLAMGLWALMTLGLGVVVAGVGGFVWGWRVVVSARGLRIAVRR